MFNIKSLSLGLLAGLFALNTVAWAAPKLELVSQVSLVENNAVAVQGNYAYTGDGKTLKIFDVSDPKNPTVVGTSAPMPDNSMEIVIKGNYAYVANARGGLRVLDISNPQLISTGNPNLNQEIRHFAMSRFSHSNKEKTSNIFGMVFFQKTLDYIANSSFAINNDTIINGYEITKGSRITIPENLDGA